LKRSAGTFSNLCPDTFRVFEVSLAGVAEAFDNKPTPWNRSYKTAQGFFENTPAGRETRRLFSLEGRTLFGGNVERQTDLSDDVDFLLGFDFGAREMMQQVWAYIVYKDSMRFCEAGNLIAHCAMAESSDEVWCAGEFIVRHENGQYSLVLDNNSGTYAPSMEALQRCTKLIKNNFSQLHVDAIKFDSDELKVLKKEFHGDPYNIYSGGLSRNPVAEHAVQRPMQRGPFIYR
jgi:hypothetical protein